VKASLIVHGGAWDIPADLIEAHKSGCKAALLRGWEILRSGGHGLEAVERAIGELEDDPTFDAGRGSVLNVVGQIELDAAIMEGSSLHAGAVAAVQNIKNPISLARQVLESEHVFLVGGGASLFARAAGIAECSTEELLVERELRRWQALRKNPTLETRDSFGFSKGDTVGAVAMDQRGNIVVGNSTGGRPYKHPGRVGDTPLVGCGIYADNTVGGAACTGWGEAIIRVAMAKTAVDLLRDDRDAQEAALLAVRLLEERVGGLGGLIMVDRTGKVGYSFNTPKMAYAYLTEDLEQPVIGV
jgi:beta-aspartyl-peptidase (threonine type)